MAVLMQEQDDSILSKLKIIHNDMCCYLRGSRNLALEDLLFEGKIVAYRKIEYSKIKGIQLVSELINIISTDPTEPKFGKFERLIDLTYEMS